VWDSGFWCFEDFGFEGCVGLWVFLAITSGFLFLLVSIRSFLCILFVCLRAVYMFFIKFSITYLKMKIKNNSRSVECRRRFPKPFYFLLGIWKLLSVLVMPRWIDCALDNCMEIYYYVVSRSLVCFYNSFKLSQALACTKYF
jgi:hypothetical protein